MTRDHAYVIAFGWLKLIIGADDGSSVNELAFSLRAGESSVGRHSRLMHHANDKMHA